MHYVILGASGFIGNSILNYLKNTGTSTIGLSSKDIDLTNINYFDRLNDILTSETVLIFSAAITKEHGDSTNLMKKNVQMVSNLCKYLQKNQIKKLVFLSSTDVYGYPKLPITEKTKLDPQTPYAISKYKSELILLTNMKKLEIPLLILRYNGIFGSGQKSLKYGPNSFIQSIIEGKPVMIWGDGKELRDLLYVDDLAKIIIELSTNSSTGIYNAASGNSHSFLDIMNLLKKVIPVKFHVINSERSGVKFDQIFDIKKLKKAFPKVTFTPLLKTLAETYQQTIN